VTLTCNLLAFSQMLALTSTPARAWKPRTIRLRLISPRYHRPPRPPHRPALQDRPPLDWSPPHRTRAPPGPTGSI